MQPDIPPRAKSQRSGFLDESILSFSTKLYENIIFGYAIAILYNLFYYIIGIVIQIYLV